jgi:transposase InsO family protein
MDDYSRKVFPFYLKSKSDAFKAFSEFKCLWEKQMQLPILRIRTDNGTEFVNTEFSNYLDQECIVAERTIPYNPEQNGKIERVHRDTTEMTTKFLLQSDAPEQMWEYSHRYACTLKNRYFPHRSLQTTLF